MQHDIIKRFNINISGSGEQPMIFVHGLGCDQVIWRKITAAFANDYKIILLDLVGSGNSDISFYDREKYSSLEGYTSDIIQVVEQLDLKNIVLVAHSVSCMIGLLAANKKPERFSNLIMIGPSLCYINDGSYKGGFTRKEINDLLEFMNNNFKEWASFITPKIVANPQNPGAAKELEESFCKTNPEVMKAFTEVTFTSDNRKDLSALKVPALIMQCSEDIIAPKLVGEYVDAQIPNSTLSVMKATGHCPHLTAPEETVELIKKYLKLAEITE